MYSPALRGALAPSACGVGLAAPSGSNVRRTAASAQAPDTVIHRASGRWRGCDRGRLPRRDPVCTENSIRVDHVSESLNVSDDDRAILCGWPCSSRRSSRRADLRQRTRRSGISSSYCGGRCADVSGSRMLTKDAIACHRISNRTLAVSEHRLLEQEIDRRLCHRVGGRL